MLTKRTTQLGGYDTASHGWTLAGFNLATPYPVTNMVSVPGRIQGDLDLSYALSDEPTYSSRDLLVTLEISSGDRAQREAIISELTNLLHGRRVKIIPPDHPNHYAMGQLTVAKLFSNHAHASVEITGICEPWLYAAQEKTLTLTASSTKKTATINNQGVMPSVPVLEITGGTVSLTYNSATISLTAGTHKWPHLFLTPGEHALQYSGSGSLRITYREGVIA